MRVSPWAQNFEAAARSLGVELDIVEADENNLDSAIAALAKNGAHGLVVTSDGVYVARGKPLAESAIKHRLPGIFAYREQVQSWWIASLRSQGRRPVTSRCLLRRSHRQGSEARRPPDRAPTKFELVINLKTAKALGLEIPPTLLARADEVIE